MENSIVNWHGYKKYNMNCSIDNLIKNGFEDSSFVHDLAPSYTNKKGNIRVWFIDLNSDEMKSEGIKYKFIIEKFPNEIEAEEGLDMGLIGETNSFEEMLQIVKENENDK